ncbi:MAG TPA: helix-turn-helix domain-containing protein [Acidimicrobiia bacterium]|nr:helix-turn-helix domain-containing protein [Acidimicrobiia bacterium]
MKTYKQYCPIARGAEVFATRWTPVIVRNLLLGCRTFTELLDGAPGIPRSVLSQRLKELEQNGIIERRQNPHGRGWLYQPTQVGKDLKAVCDAIGAWGAKWVELRPQHLDPYYSLWAMARGLRAVELPEGRINTRFELPRMPADKARFWLLVQEPEPEVCVRHPGHEEDLVITADPAWLARWVLGESTLAQGMKREVVAVKGPPPLVRTLGRLGEQAASALQRWGEPVPGA